LGIKLRALDKRLSRLGIRIKELGER